MIDWRKEFNERSLDTEERLKQTERLVRDVAGERDDLAARMDALIAAHRHAEGMGS